MQKKNYNKEIITQSKYDILFNRRFFWIKKILWFFEDNFLSGLKKPSFERVSFEAKLNNAHFVRYVMYRDIAKFIKSQFGSKSSLKIIEFGESNGMISSLFNKPELLNPLYPKTDIQNLAEIKKNYYDVTILDQVLEHVQNPQRAINEIYRILKKGGWLICTTPFLVQIHPSPNDYWRFTKQGLETLLEKFSSVAVKSWGNRQTAAFHLLRGDWLTSSRIKKLGMHRFLLKNEVSYPYIYWVFARK